MRFAHVAHVAHVARYEVCPCWMLVLNVGCWMLPDLNPAFKAACELISTSLCVMPAFCGVFCVHACRVIQDTHRSVCSSLLISATMCFEVA